MIGEMEGKREQPMMELRVVRDCPIIIVRARLVGPLLLAQQCFIERKGVLLIDCNTPPK